MSRIARTCASATTRAFALFLLLSWPLLHPSLARADDSSKRPVVTGQAAFTNTAHESPGARRHITVGDLPAPAPDQSVRNGADVKFVTASGKVWGRPWVLTEGKDGSLFVSDDGSRSIWRVSYVGK